MENFVEAVRAVASIKAVALAVWLYLGLWGFRLGIGHWPRNRYEWILCPLMSALGLMVFLGGALAWLMVKADATSKPPRD